MDRVLGFSCLCQEGFTGELCTTEINECEGLEQQACQNGGTCIDRIGETIESNSTYRGTKPSRLSLVQKLYTMVGQSRGKGW